MPSRAVLPGDGVPDLVASVRSLARAEPAGRAASDVHDASAVRRPPFRWKTRVLLPAGLLIGFASSLAYTARDALIRPRPVKVVPVVLAPGDVPATTGGTPVSAGGTVQAPGWVEPDPFPIAVPSLTDGFVREVLVLEGQAVTKGQVVARLIDDDSKLALAKVEAELAQREATVQAAQSTWDNPIERTRAVAANAGKVEESRAALSMLEAEIAAAAAKAAEARYESERVTQASETRAATGLEASAAQQRRAGAEATLDATKRKRVVLQQQLVQADAELTAAKENQRLRIAEGQALAEARAAADLARAARDEARLRLSRMEIRSPVDGVVMSRHAEPGTKMMLSMDHPLSCVVVRLYDPKRLQVRVDVPLADAAKVSVGQDAQVTVSKLPDRVFHARVTRIVHEADLQKNTQQFKVAILDPAPELAPEMLARAKFLPLAATAGTQPAAGGGRTTLFAPASLLRIQGDASQATAWVVDPSRRVATRRTVQLGGATRGDWVAVAAGLSVGDQLIADTDGLTEGQKVRVDGEADVPAAADPPSSGMPPGKGAAHGVH